MGLFSYCMTEYSYLMALLSCLNKRLPFSIFRAYICKKPKHQGKQLDTIFLSSFVISNSAGLIAAFLVPRSNFHTWRFTGYYQFFFLSGVSNMVFISLVEEEGKHLVNCLQASIKVVSTFVELEQTVKQVCSATEHGSFLPTHIQNS